MFCNALPRTKLLFLIEKNELKFFKFIFSQFKKITRLYLFNLNCNFLLNKLYFFCLLIQFFKHNLFSKQKKLLNCIFFNFCFKFSLELFSKIHIKCKIDKKQTVWIFKVSLDRITQCFLL